MPCELFVMAYVDGFEYDVFLSYARVDDLTVTEDELGWVSSFEKHLRVSLEQRVGRIGAVRLWRDLRQIDGSQLFDRTIDKALDEVAVFVALTSRGYLKSEHCRKELDHFHRRASGDRFGLAVGDRLRIVNVLLTNLDPGEWPSRLGRTGGFYLHDAEHDDQTGEPSEPGNPLFKRQLRALADAVHNLLTVMKEGTRPTTPPTERARGTVYLADVADTLRTRRRNLTHDLKQRHIEVVSGVPPPYDPTGHDNRMIEVLRGADLSVHLLDDIAGREIEDREGHTYLRRQVELAGKHARSRLIWVPRDLDLAKIKHASHAAFLRGLERGENGGGACDFIRGMRAELAGEIQDKVELLRPASETAATNGNGASCMLVFHTKDMPHMLPVASQLTDEGAAPYLNHDESEPQAVLDLFEDRVRQVASLIIFYGEVQREWVRKRLEAAIKIRAREQLELRLAVFAAPPEKPPGEVSFSYKNTLVETLASAGEALAFVGNGS